MAFSLLVFIASFFLFLLTMIGSLKAYFARLWSFFWLWGLCAIVSGGLMFLELDLLLILPSPHDMTLGIPQRAM